MDNRLSNPNYKPYIDKNGNIVWNGDTVLVKRQWLGYVCNIDSNVNGKLLFFVSEFEPDGSGQGRYFLEDLEWMNEERIMIWKLEQ